MLDPLTAQLAARGHLSDEQVRLAVEQLVDATVPADAKAEFLSSLALKGETVGEIAAFAMALRDKAIQPPIDPATRAGEILDVCGTGGDRLNTFNISTTVAIICAAAGVAVAKHGNRAITSQAGSADVLEALGIRIDGTPAEAAQSLRERRFGFFFAPHYHPAFKNIAPARKLCAERGQRTVFNLLGPLLNPARPTSQLVGVPLPQWCEPLARVLQVLGVRRAMVVSGRAGSAAAKSNSESKDLPSGATAPQSDDAGNAFLDEMSTLGDTTVAEFYQERGFSVSVLAPEPFRWQRASLADLGGGGREANAEIVRRILRGEDRGPKREAVALNAAAGLLVAGRVRSLTDGLELATGLIDGGGALAKLKELADG